MSSTSTYSLQTSTAASTTTSSSSSTSTALPKQPPTNPQRYDQVLLGETTSNNNNNTNNTVKKNDTNNDNIASSRSNHDPATTTITNTIQEQNSSILPFHIPSDNYWVNEGAQWKWYSTSSSTSSSTQQQQQQHGNNGTQWILSYAFPLDAPFLKRRIDESIQQHTIAPMTSNNINNNNINSTAAATPSTPSPLSFVLYGSSHVRELYFALLRLHRGIRYDAALEQNVTWLPSGNQTNITKMRICDPTRSGHLGGLYGVDLENCGVPGRRIIFPEAHHRAAYQFKTYIHTPQAETLFLEYLQDHRLRHPTVVVVDLNIWGPRGKRKGGPTQTILTVEEEVDYYLDWLVTSFPQSRIVMIWENNRNYGAMADQYIEQRLPKMVRQHPQRLYVWHKDYLLKRKPKNLPCVHGCGGPLMQVMAMQLLDFLQSLKKNQKSTVSDSTA